MNSVEQKSACETLSPHLEHDERPEDFIAPIEDQQAPAVPSVNFPLQEPPSAKREREADEVKEKKRRKKTYIS